jgi:hypothetical protein
MRLIDADALKKQYYPFPCAIGVENAVTIRAINEAPTIDAAPVVRGEWVKCDDYKGWLVCSVCHDCYVDNEWVNGKKWRYCPNCGAKMESEGNT